MKKGETIAYQQFPVTGYQFPTLPGVLAAQNGQAVEKQEQLACVILNAGKLTVYFNKSTGWIDYLDVDGRPMLEKGYSVKPEFWRAPTDNDMGAELHRKWVAWKEPQMELKSFKCEQSGNNYVVTADYKLPSVASQLLMTYTVTPNGEIIVNEKMQVDHNAKDKPELFRYGMQLVMPEAYTDIAYYGRGPIENYCDRNNNTLLGIYNDKVANQYAKDYIRPQESGNKTDIRWWKVMNVSKKGLEFYGVKPIECSTLNYLASDLDDGWEKHQRHSGDLMPRPFSVVHISDRQMGVGGIHSWGTLPLPQYRIPYAYQDFTFVIRPLSQ